MTREISYKLGRYKIIEGPGNALGWESHTGFAGTQTGRCFIEGNILIIGPADGEQPGFLKREFMESLNKLPAWEKTKYYCSSQSIYKSKTGRTLSFTTEVGKHVDLSLEGQGSSIFSDMQEQTGMPKEPPGRKKAGILKNVGRPKSLVVIASRFSKESAGIIREGLFNGKIGQVWSVLKRLTGWRFR